MAYRNPAAPPASPESRELDDYERKLLRNARRKKVVFAAVVVALSVFGLGSCVGPMAMSLASRAWGNQKTKLTEAEAKEVRDLIDPLESTAKQSQEAITALWPKLRAGELGPRKDLGRCKVAVPGPNILKENESTSLRDSSHGTGWVFVDLSSKSPLAGLKMPQGSMPLDSTGTGGRYVLPATALRTEFGDTAPTLASTTTGLEVATWRAEAAAPIRRNGHESFLQRVRIFARDPLSVDVVVFLDEWEDPKVTDSPSPRDKLEALEKGARPTATFESGRAVARAFAWSPTRKELVCASEAVAESSNDIRVRGGDVAPLQQDLVLQLEKALQRSFVAAGSRLTPR